MPAETKVLTELFNGMEAAAHRIDSILTAAHIEGLRGRPKAADLQDAIRDALAHARALSGAFRAIRPAADEGPTCYVCDGVLPAGARYCPPPCGAGPQNPRE